MPIDLFILILQALEGLLEILAAEMIQGRGARRPRTGATRTLRTPESLRPQGAAARRCRLALWRSLTAWSTWCCALRAPTRRQPRRVRLLTRSWHIMWRESGCCNSSRRCCVIKGSCHGFKGFGCAYLACIGSENVWTAGPSSMETDVASASVGGTAEGPASSNGNATDAAASGGAPAGGSKVGILAVTL